MPKSTRDRAAEAGHRIRYPLDWLLAVIDDPAAAQPAALALVDAGFDPEHVKVLEGATADGSLSDLPTSSGAIGQLIRLVQFMSMDQTPDLRLYEAALDDGRAIIAVHCAERDRLLRARDILAASGAHFQNHFGRYATEEFSRWRGPELHPTW
ncbi:MAG: hypothetical protein ACRDGI_10595 [Candidatus Limnocylindrales bacterium]